jgi:hypothetical protein
MNDRAVKVREISREALGDQLGKIFWAGNSRANSSAEQGRSDAQSRSLVVYF